MTESLLVMYYVTETSVLSSLNIFLSPFNKWLDGNRKLYLSDRNKDQCKKFIVSFNVLLINIWDL